MNTYEDGIGDLVTDLVGVSLTNGLATEQYGERREVSDMVEMEVSRSATSTGCASCIPQRTHMGEEERRCVWARLTR